MKAILSLVLLFAALLFPQAGANEADLLTPEQQAAVSWVLDNQSKSINLTEAAAAKIVKIAYYYAEERKLDPHHLLAMIRIESRFNHKAKSSEGAVGLMQVIPRWHRKAINKRNPFDPYVSIEVGSLVYADCLKKYSGNVRKAVGCYSGGAVKYYAIVEQSKKQLMHHIIAELFVPNSVMVASR